MRWLLTLGLVLLPAWAAASDDKAWISQGWSIAAVAGPWSNQDSSEIFLNGRWETQSVVVMGTINKELFRLAEPFVIEAEADLGRHFHGASDWVFSGHGVARWQRFPWNDTVETTFAGGYGLSFSTGAPTEADGSKLLASLIFELTLTEPGSDIAATLRYQHRSSSFGLTSDGQQDEGTGFLLGIRYRFP